VNVKCKLVKVSIKKKRNFLVINYDDLDDKRKSIYDKVFDTKQVPEDFIVCDDLDFYL
jgi:hypothetical protein